MNLFRALAVVAGLVALAALPGHEARAQASCPIGPPLVLPTTTTSYALTNNNECQAIVFTSPNPATVTYPNANTVAPGFQVTLFSVAGGLSIVQGAGTASTVNTSAAGVGISAGQSGLLYGDGTNYWFYIGSGFAQTAPNSVIGSAALGRLSGTTAATSPMVMMPNGMMQITNEASFRPGNYPFQACAGAPLAVGAGATGTTRSPYLAKPWLQIVDNSGRPWLIPLCAPNP